jgi:hypothetical protein
MHSTPYAPASQKNGRIPEECGHFLIVGRGDWIRAKRGASRATPEDVAPAGRERRDADGRGDWIRTSDLSVPNRALYQAEPRPDEAPSVTAAVPPAQAVVL